MRNLEMGTHGPSPEDGGQRPGTKNNEQRTTNKEPERSAQAEQPGSRAVVVTRDDEFLMHSPLGGIEIVPVWKWLLER